jgi:hypothetical protein
MIYRAYILACIPQSSNQNRLGNKLHSEVKRTDQTASTSMLLLQSPLRIQEFLEKNLLLMT